MTKNQNKIHGSINSAGRRNGKSMYNRLRIAKKYWDKFKRIDKITVKYHRDSFVAQIDNKLFSDYGEIDNYKILKWFGNKHTKIDINITHLRNLNSMEIL